MIRNPNLSVKTVRYSVTLCFPIFFALLGKDTFKVKISSLDKREHIRIHVPPPLDRQDGTFLVRYRLYGTVQKGLKVEVHHQDAAVAKSPYSIQGLSSEVVERFTNSSVQIFHFLHL